MKLPSKGLDLRVHLGELEDQYIIQALQKTEGNVTHAAALLGLERTTLVEKIRRRRVNYSVDLKTGVATEVYTDPEGEFTYRRRAPSGYEVLYKGEPIASRRTLAAVSAYIKKKVEE